MKDDYICSCCYSTGGGGSCCRSASSRLEAFVGETEKKNEKRKEESVDGGMSHFFRM